MSDAPVGRAKGKKEIVMAKAGESYTCDVCGNTVYLVEGGDGDLVCCGQDMRLLDGAEAKAVTEKIHAAC